MATTGLDIALVASLEGVSAQCKGRSPHIQYSPMKATRHGAVRYQCREPPGIDILLISTEACFNLNPTLIEQLDPQSIINTPSATPPKTASMPDINNVQPTDNMTEFQQSGHTQAYNPADPVGQQDPAYGRARAQRDEHEPDHTQQDQQVIPQAAPVPYQFDANGLVNEKIPYQLDANGAPLLAFTQASAATHRNRITWGPNSRDPLAEQASIAQAKTERQILISRMVQAFFNVTDIADRENSSERKRFTFGTPGSISGYDIEATCHALFEAVIVRCEEGYRGPKTAPKGYALLRCRKEDSESLCEERFDNVITALRSHKTICRDVLFNEYNRMLLADHPVTYANNKALVKKNNGSKKKAYDENQKLANEVRADPGRDSSKGKEAVQVQSGAPVQAALAPGNEQLQEFGPGVDGFDVDGFLNLPPDFDFTILDRPAVDGRYMPSNVPFAGYTPASTDEALLDPGLIDPGLDGCPPIQQHNPRAMAIFDPTGPLLGESLHDSGTRENYRIEHGAQQPAPNSSSIVGGAGRKENQPVDGTAVCEEQTRPAKKPRVE